MARKVSVVVTVLECMTFEKAAEAVGQWFRGGSGGKRGSLVGGNGFFFRVLESSEDDDFVE